MSRTIRSYPTGLVATDYWYSPKTPYVGKGWRITLRDRDHPEADEIRESYRGKRMPRSVRHALRIGKELVVHAANETEVRRAALTLHAAYCLIDGGMQTLFPGMNLRRTAPSSLEELDKYDTRVDQAEDVLLDQGRGILLSRPGFVVAAQIAAKASKARRLEYALFKYYLSVYLVTVDPSDLHPIFAEPDFAPSSLALDHVWFAQSILSANGVIEELGLNVRASQQNPSMIDGQWNPKVRNDLVGRLTTAGVGDPEGPITLCFRGRKTELERRKPPRRGTPTRWASKRGEIRDQDVPLIDAINWLSRIRSDVSAHNMTELSSKLTPVDVFNGQTIARRLMLTATGFWDEEHETIPSAPRDSAGLACFVPKQAAAARFRAQG